MVSGLTDIILSFVIPTVIPEEEVTLNDTE
jgi:hypothetical protein